jgi:hypothetical protein
VCEGECNRLYRGVASRIMAQEKCNINGPMLRYLHNAVKGASVKGAIVRGTNEREDECEMGECDCMGNRRC